MITELTEQPTKREKVKGELWCASCKQYFPETSFWTDRSAKYRNFRYSYCKSCGTERRNLYSQKKRGKDTHIYTISKELAQASEAPIITELIDLPVQQRTCLVCTTNYPITHFPAASATDSVFAVCAHCIERARAHGGRGVSSLYRSFYAQNGTLMRECSGCGKAKPLTHTNFNYNRNMLHGLTLRCRECRALYKKPRPAKRSITTHEQTDSQRALEGMTQHVYTQQITKTTSFRTVLANTFRAWANKLTH